MADGTSGKPKWRNLGSSIDLTQVVSPDLAAVLVLHHLELAAAYFNSLDLEAAPDDVDADNELVDPLAFHLRSNEERYKLVMRHMKQRYKDRHSAEAFQDAVPVFMLAINKYWDEVWREEFSPNADGDDKS